MSEHLKYLGQRQELQMRKKALEIKGEGIVRNMRDALDPLACIGDLRVDAIAEWAIELADVSDRYNETIAGLKQIADILGK